MWHYVRTKICLFSLSDVKKVCTNCKTCAEVKSQLYCPEQHKLIKAAQFWECISIEFKRSLESNKRNPYFLSVTDKYSRFPFVFPCSNMSAEVILKCIESLLSMFGMCYYVQSDQDTSLMSSPSKEFFMEKGIAISHSTPFHH